MGKNPTDRGKQGTKRSLLTEGGGVHIGVVVEGSNRNDFKLLRETIESIAIERPRPTPEHHHHHQQQQGMCLDKGYDYNEVREILKEFGFTAHIRARGEEAQAIKRQAGYKELGDGWYRTDTQLDEPLPGDPGPLGEEGGQLLGPAPPLLCLYNLQASWPTGIGSYKDPRIL